MEPTTKTIHDLDVERPRPGLYTGVPVQVFHDLPGCSYRDLHTIHLRSPAHARLPQVVTPGMVFGSAFKTYLLGEVDETRRWFNTQFGILLNEDGTEVNLRTKVGKERREVLRSAYGDYLLKAEDMVRIETMDRVMRSHHHFQQLDDLSQDLETRQVVLLWMERTRHGDIPCKVRLDLPRFYSDTIKCTTFVTTSDASSTVWPRRFYDVGYWLKDALIRRGLSHLGRVGTTEFVVIERDPPFGIQVFHPTPLTRDTSEMFMIGLLETYGECLFTNRWESYPDRPVDLALPHWTNLGSL